VVFHFKSNRIVFADSSCRKPIAWLTLYLFSYIIVVIKVGAGVDVEAENTGTAQPINHQAYDNNWHWELRCTPQQN